MCMFCALCINPKHKQTSTVRSEMISAFVPSSMQYLVSLMWSDAFAILD